MNKMKEKQCFIIKRISILIVCFVVLIFDTLAQNAGTNMVSGIANNVPSPYASNFGEYGLVPVSPYSGKADISIPVYSTSERGVNLDISLCYNSSGLLANNLPEWTGHGWTLMAGGTITRKINNMPDELRYQEYAGHNYYSEENPKKKSSGLIGTIEYLNWWKEKDKEEQRCRYFTNYFTNASMVKNAKSYGDFAGEAESAADYSADVFYFNFLGITGSFFYGNDGQWKVSCDRNIAVIFNVNDAANYIKNYEEYYTDTNIKQPNTIKGFTLIDDAGYKYVFGGSQSSIEYATNVMLRHKYNTTSPWIATTWMLTEVQDRFGNVLYSFKYSRGKNIVQLYNSYTDFRINGYSLRKTPAISGTLNAPVYLDEIKTMTGTNIFFEHEKVSNLTYQTLYPSFGDFAGDNWQNMIKSTYPAYEDETFKSYFIKHPMKGEDDLTGMVLEKLNKISVYNGTKSEKYKITETSLNYSFDSRMHLVSLSLGDGTSRSKEYKLEYYNYDMLPADYLTSAIDYWGYYNDIPKDLTNQNRSTRTSMSFSESKIPNLDASKCGMLRKLVYPEGGYAEFDYELNEYSSYIKGNGQNSGNSVAGGLRIKSVTNWDKGSIIGKKTYTYLNDNGKSSGELYNQPNTSYSFKKDNAHVTVENTCSMFPLSNSFSCVVGYSFVRETNLDGSSIEYEFYNYSDSKDEEGDLIMTDIDVLNPFVESSSRTYMCGNLKAKRFYGREDDLLSETLYTYLSDQEFNTGNYVSTTGFSVINNGERNIYVGGRYKLFYPKVRVLSVVDKTYIPGERGKGAYVVERCTNNSYDYSKIGFYMANKKYEVDVLQNKKSVSSDGRNINSMSMEYQYANQGQGFYRFLADKFYLPLISTKRYIDGRLIDGSKTIYGKCNEEYVPSCDLRFYENEDVCDTVANYMTYSRTFKPTEYSDEYGINHKLFYDIHDRLFAQVDNSTKEVLPGMSNEAKNVFQGDNNVFGSKPVNAAVTVFNTRGLVDNVVSGNKQSVYYKYNTWNDISKILDQDKKVLKTVNYNYSSSDNVSKDVVADATFAPMLGENYSVKEHYIESLNYQKYTVKNRQTQYKIFCYVKMQPGASNCKIGAHAIYPDDGLLSPTIYTNFTSNGGQQMVEVDVDKLKTLRPFSRVEEEVSAWNCTFVIELYSNGKVHDSQTIEVRFEKDEDYDKIIER